MISGGKGKKRTDCASGNRETDIAFHTKDGSHICCNATMTDIPKDKDKTKTKTKKKTKTNTKDWSFICDINAALIAKQARVPHTVESAWTIEKYFSFFLRKSFDARARAGHIQSAAFVIVVSVALHDLYFTTDRNKWNDSGKLHWNKCKTQTNQQNFSQQHL